MADPFKNESSFNFLRHLLISLIFYWRPTPLKSVTMATINALFPIFEFQNFTNTYLGKVTKLQFNYFSRLGAAFRKPEGAVRLGLKVKIDFLMPILQDKAKKIFGILSHF